MPELTLTQWDILLLAIATASVAGLVRGFTGFGGPAVMMLVLTQFYSPASVMILVLLVDYAANIQLLPSAIRQVNWRTIAPLAIASMVTLPIGIHLLLYVDPVQMKRGIALVTGVCACVMLANWRYRREVGATISTAVGLIGGVIVGATFVALPIIIFIFAGPAAAAVSRANTLSWGFCTSTVIIGVFLWHDMLGLDNLWQAALIAVAYMTGAFGGARAFRKASEQLFRRVVLTSLLGLSLIGILT